MKHHKLTRSCIIKGSHHFVGGTPKMSASIDFFFFLLAQPNFERRLLFISNLGGRSFNATIEGSNLLKRAGVPLGFHLISLFSLCISSLLVLLRSKSLMRLVSAETFTIFLLLSGVRAVVWPQGLGEEAWGVDSLLQRLDGISSCLPPTTPPSEMPGASCPWSCQHNIGCFPLASSSASSSCRWWLGKVSFHTSTLARSSKTIDPSCAIVIPMPGLLVPGDSQVFSFVLFLLHYQHFIVGRSRKKPKSLNHCFPWSHLTFLSPCFFKHETGVMTISWRSLWEFRYRLGHTAWHLVDTQ